MIDAVRLVDTSGNTAKFDTSGRVTIAGGSITASISGDTVRLDNVFSGIVPTKIVTSGGALSVLSTTASDVASNGNTVIYTAAFNYALRESGTGIWARLRMTESGVADPMSGIGHKLAVDFSGANTFVQASASTFFAAVKIVNSGNANAALMQSWSSDTINPGNQMGVVSDTMLYGAREIANTASRVRLTESGVADPMSGIGFKLGVDFSGAVARIAQGSGMNGVFLTDQGNTSGVAVGAATSDVESTATVRLRVDSSLRGFDPIANVWTRLRVSTSGQTALSGVSNKLVVDFSGAYGINNVGQVIAVPAWTQVTGASGGVALNAAVGHTIKISNHSGNGAVLVGASGGNAPVSGTKGIMIPAGTIEEFRVTNANLLSAVGHTSGNFISYMAYG